MDPKPTYLSHIRYLQVRCKKSLDNIKVLPGTDGGSDCVTLLMLYKAIVLFKLNYGSIIYGFASPRFLRPHDVVHDEGLRLCLGENRTSLYVESNVLFFIEIFIELLF